MRRRASLFKKAYLLAFDFLLGAAELTLILGEAIFIAVVAGLIGPFLIVAELSKERAVKAPSLLKYVVCMIVLIHFSITWFTILISYSGKDF